MEHSGGAVDQSGGENGDHAGQGRDAAPAAPATACARLRAAREAQGLTTADIAKRTRITLRHVEALDRGNLSDLPGRPYVIGFVRNYARAVGLDGDTLVALVRREMESVPSAPAPRTVHQFDVDDPAKTPSRLVTWLALALFACILGAGAVFWRNYLVPDAGLPALVSSEPTAAPSAAAAPPPAAAAPAPAPTGPVVFTAREPGIWVKFYDGHGQQLLQKELALNEAYTVPADAFEPKLWTGRPDALAISIGGQSVAPLSDHRGVMRDVPVTAQALLARSAPPPTPTPTPTPTLSASGAPAPQPPVIHRRPRRADPDPTASTDAAPAAAASAAPAPVASPSP